MNLQNPLTRRQSMVAFAGAAATLPMFAALARADHHMHGGMTGDYTEQTLMLGTMSLKASEMVADKAQTPQVKTFAELEAAEQETVAEILKANGATAPANLPEPMQAKLDRMMQMDGMELERMYVTEQIDVHNQLLGVQEQMKGEPLTDPKSVLAHLGIDAIKSHLAMLEMIRGMM